MAQYTTFNKLVYPSAEQVIRTDQGDSVHDMLAYFGSALVETSIEPQRKNIAPWDGPLFFIVLVTFCVFIALALLNSATSNKRVKAKPLKLHLISQPLKGSRVPLKKMPDETQQKHAPIDQKTSNSEDSYVARADINFEQGPAEQKQLKKPQLHKPQINKRHHSATSHTKTKNPQVARSPHALDRIQSVIDDENRSTGLDKESGDGKNTAPFTTGSLNSGPLNTGPHNSGPHNTVFDNNLRQYLHSKELRQFNRRRHRVDIGNYSDSTAEHFSDGSGNCFRIIDNVGETLWIPKKCPKVQSKRTEFGRLVSEFN